MKGLEGDLKRLTKRNIKFLRKEKKRFSEDFGQYLCP